MHDDACLPPFYLFLKFVGGAEKKRRLRKGRNLQGPHLEGVHGMCTAILTALIIYEMQSCSEKFLSSLVGSFEVELYWWRLLC